MIAFVSKLALTSALIAGLFSATTSQADDLSTVKDRGELRIAMSGAFPPFSFVNEQNQVIGFDVDIGNELAKRLGVKPVIITTAWDGIIAGLIASKYDTVVGSMTVTPERQKAVDFAGPYYHGGRGIFTAENSPINRLDDLKGKTVGVTLGETHEKWAREHGGWNIQTYKGLPELFLELRAGRLDAIIVDAIPVLVAVKDSGEKIRQLDTPGIGGAEDVGIALRRNSPELKAAVQKALDDMMADGAYEKISLKWIGRDIR